MSAALEKDGVRLIDSIETATTFRSRLVGLIGRKSLPGGSAFLIPACGSVHTFFMRFDLDLVFIDCTGRVVKVARNISPFRLVFGGPRAATTIEMASGWLPADALHPGDIVTVTATDCR
ncbi:MAG: DUF192 domain-containing protein [bacterium]